jgi:RHS repeat-associated protein
LGGTRRLTKNYKAAVDWQDVDAIFPSDHASKVALASLEGALVSLVESEIFTNAMFYDALNRPIQIVAPYTDQANPKRINVIRPGYSEANLLERLDVWLNQSSEPSDLLNPAKTPPSGHGVKNIDYNAKGQRILIEYGNGASTAYTYDPLTFRLTNLLTTRGENLLNCDPQLDPRTCQDPPLVCSWLQSYRCILQNLSYTYDPVGNITHIQDDAQQIIYFRNKRVEPSSDYTYDAIYRLIEATGREHLGQTNGQPNPPTAPDALNSFHTRLDHPNDGNALGTYIESYIYDAVGNILSMQHSGTDPKHRGWAREYTYSEPSLLETGKNNNRLTRTEVSSVPETYSYKDALGQDVHGCMTSINSMLMTWDFKDQLQHVNLGGGGIAYYVYDTSGRRVRKVIHRQNGTKQKERIYLGGFEIYREYNGAGGTTPKLERETLHIMDDKQRIALVETRTLDTAGNDPTPRQLICHQFGNHLGSASLELDDQAQIISYEEYFPYGSTSYQTVRSGLETNPKRYRFTGKERDEESGLYYHEARYYAPWLARWASCDPAGMADGFNVYVYTKNNPLVFIDFKGTDSNTPQSNQVTQEPLKTFDENKQTTFDRHRPNKMEETARKNYTNLSPSQRKLRDQQSAPVKQAAAREEILQMMPFDEQMIYVFSEFTGGNDMARAWTGASEWNEEYSTQERILLGAEGLATAYSWAAPADGFAKSALPLSSNAKMAMAIRELNNETVTIYRLVPINEAKYTTIRAEAWVTTEESLVGASGDEVMSSLDVITPTELGPRYQKGAVLVRAETTMGNLQLPKPASLNEVGPYRSALPTERGLSAGQPPVSEFQLRQPVPLPEQPTIPVLKPSPPKQGT